MPKLNRPSTVLILCVNKNSSQNLFCIKRPRQWHRINEWFSISSVYSVTFNRSVGVSASFDGYRKFNILIWKISSSEDTSGSSHWIRHPLLRIDGFEPILRRGKKKLISYWKIRIVFFRQSELKRIFPRHFREIFLARIVRSIQIFQSSITCGNWIKNLCWIFRWQKLCECDKQ